MSIEREPAFPTLMEPIYEGQQPQHIPGMTRLEYFAGLAMQANRARGSAYNNWADLAKDSVEIATALIAELEKSQ